MNVQLNLYIKKKSNSRKGPGRWHKGSKRGCRREYQRFEGKSYRTKG